MDPISRLTRSEVVSSDELLSSLSEKGRVTALLRGKQEKDRELFLCLLLLSYLQLKRIFLPKWHIVGWLMCYPSSALNISVIFCVRNNKKTQQHRKARIYVTHTHTHTHTHTQTDQKSTDVSWSGLGGSPGLGEALHTGADQLGITHMDWALLGCWAGVVLLHMSPSPCTNGLAQACFPHRERDIPRSKPNCRSTF